MVKRGFSFFVLALVIVGIGFFVFSPKLPRGRVGIVLHGDPTIVVSWESDRNRFAVFLLPAALQIEALNGYGWYSLDALWKLDTMDCRAGSLYRTSLEEAFATPIRWHGDVSFDASSVSGDSVIPFVKGIFSFPNMFHQVITKETNIHVWEMFPVWKKIQLLGPDTATVFDFRNGQIAYEEEMPDQTIAVRFDKEKYDAIVGNSLEDTPLRQEGMRIALYNTTATSGIAQRIARVVEHTGGFVVSVGNEDIPYDGMCEVLGNKSFLSSYTAIFFRSMYGCVLMEQEEGMRADIVVRLGSGMERRYLPGK